MEQIRRVKRKLVHRGAIIHVYEDTMEMPNGKTALWDFIEHRGAAAILAVDGDGRILMVRQYRGAIEKNSLEIPAGGLNPGEDFKTCAIRELEEETGFRTLDAEPLLELFTTVAFCNEKIGIYYTENLIPSKQHLDEDEFVTVERYTLDELTDMVMNGSIQDAKTISAILAYRTLRENK